MAIEIKVKIHENIIRNKTEKLKLKNNHKPIIQMKGKTETEGKNTFFKTDVKKINK